jgi:hypothetical protein
LLIVEQWKVEISGMKMNAEERRKIVAIIDQANEASTAKG